MQIVVGKRLIILVNETEKILNAFSNVFFYKELVINNLKFVPVGTKEEKELADLLFNFGDIILAIQLKGRNAKYQTEDLGKETKWLGKECRDAKKQVKKTIEFIETGVLPSFKNERNYEVKIKRDAEVIPLIIFMNGQIKEYPHILKKHTQEGMDVNGISYDDFQIMCKTLITPMEIIEYLNWRLHFYQDNGNVNMWLQEDMKGNLIISKPQNNEALVHQFLLDQYGTIDINRECLIEFQNFLHRMPEHSVFESEENASYPLILFFSHFRRVEIIPFIERLKLSVEKSANKIYGIVGSLRNIIDNYAIIFVTSKYGAGVPMELLFDVAKEKGEVKKLLQIIVYWENDIEYRVDFQYCDFTVSD